MKNSLFILTSLAFSLPALAHFGTVIPDKDIVSQPKDSTVKVEIAFIHPMEQEGMTMEKPESFFVVSGGNKRDLTERLTTKKVLDKDAWEASFAIKKPGLYTFVSQPKPYWEPAEDKFIVHYTKTAVPAFGEEEGWDEPVGLPVEIVPLNRPFGNYSGNLFRGVVLKDGKPVPNAEVEVEYLNREKQYEAPNEIFVTQVIKADQQGVFSYAVPWAGWWGFAALIDGDQKITKDGNAKDVELGGVYWSKFSDPKLRK